MFMDAPDHVNSMRQTCAIFNRNETPTDARRQKDTNGDGQS